MSPVRTQTHKVNRTLIVGSLAMLAAGLFGDSASEAAQDRGEALSNSSQTVATEAAQNATTTLTDQSDLNVTVYNSNIALVRDVRDVTLPSGLFRLKLEDIAASVNPATVHFVP